MLNEICELLATMIPKSISREHIYSSETNGHPTHIQP